MAYQYGFLEQVALRGRCDGCRGERNVGGAANRGVGSSQALGELTRGTRSLIARGQEWELNLGKWIEARSSSCICFVSLNSKHFLTFESLSTK